MLLASAVLAGCRHDDPDRVRFENHLYIDSGEMSAQLPVKPSTDALERTLSIASAKPVEGGATIRFEADPSRVRSFCEAYYTEAEMLPEEFWSIDPAEVTIPSGGVRSTEATVHFSGLKGLDMSRNYVLPVTARTSEPILKRAKTYYFLLSEGAVINVVADIRQTYIEFPKFNNSSPLNNLRAITMEALIKADRFDRMISTVMGIEGHYLMRIGDEGYESNQIQIAGSNSSENFPSASESPAIPVGRWVHVAVTHDFRTGAWCIYYDGELRASGTKTIGNRNMGSPTDVSSPGKGFHIGLSYDKNRWLEGCICECRIWNKVRTQEEISEYRYEVDPESEGLVAYWKFDEGSGSVIHDYTPYGNDGRVGQNASGEIVRGITWTRVWLPERTEE